MTTPLRLLRQSLYLSRAQLIALSAHWGLPPVDERTLRRIESGTRKGGYIEQHLVERLTALSVYIDKVAGQSVEALADVDAQAAEHDADRVALGLYPSQQTYNALADDDTRSALPFVQLHDALMWRVHQGLKANGLDCGVYFYE
jgi:hypothetical protein